MASVISSLTTPSRARGEVLGVCFPCRSESVGGDGEGVERSAHEAVGQRLLITLMTGLAEAIPFARRHGLDLDQFVEVLTLPTARRLPRTLRRDSQLDFDGADMTAVLKAPQARSQHSIITGQSFSSR